MVCEYIIAFPLWDTGKLNSDVQQTHTTTTTTALICNGQLATAGLWSPAEKCIKSQKTPIKSFAATERQKRRVKLKWKQKQLLTNYNLPAGTQVQCPSKSVFNWWNISGSHRDFFFIHFAVILFAGLSKLLLCLLLTFINRKHSSSVYHFNETFLF